MFDITVKTTSQRIENVLDINLLFPLSMLPLSGETAFRILQRQPYASRVLFPVLTEIKHDIIREIIVVL